MAEAARFAYVTLVMGAGAVGEGYALGAIALAASLASHGAAHPIVVLVTAGVCLWRIAANERCS